MNDKLKLSDPTGDVELDKIARQVVVEYQSERVKELERSIAQIKNQISNHQKTSQPRPAGASNQIGARKNASFKAISAAPSINKTPRGPTMVPVAYTTVQDLSASVNIANTVRFNGDPAYLLDASTQLSCKGDEQGTGGGVRSGTVNGAVRPLQGALSVKAQGKKIVRQGDPCTMNGGNNLGTYVTTQRASQLLTKIPTPHSNPSNFSETNSNWSQLSGWWNDTSDEIAQALHKPGDGIVGILKATLNQIPDLGELIAKAAMEERAAELERSSLLLDQFGLTNKSVTQRDVARQIRKQGSDLSLPRLEMNNGAQAGGAHLLLAAQTGSGIGLSKAASRIASKPIQRLKAVHPDMASVVEPSLVAEGTGIKVVGKPKKTAAERSGSFQGKDPYPGVDRMRNISLEEDKLIAHVTYSLNGRPTSEYFTTLSAIRRATLSNGKVDANKLNQGLQIYPGIDPTTDLMRGSFKPYVQIFRVDKKIPLGEVALGRTLKNPALNPDKHSSLPQLFINEEYHGALVAEEIVEVTNNITPKYRLK